MDCAVAEGGEKGLDQVFLESCLDTKLPAEVYLTRDSEQSIIN